MENRFAGALAAQKNPSKDRNSPRLGDYFRMRQIPMTSDNPSLSFSASA